MHQRQQSIDKFLKPKMDLLTSFPQFSKLPTELRALIWNASLQPRVLEIMFTESRGFYTRVGTPTALRVCKDSRAAVTSSYPVCFGNAMFKPRTLFNLSLDTLLIGMVIQDHILHLFASLTAKELTGIHYLAIYQNINFDYEHGDETDVDYMKAVKTAAKSMSSLKLFQYVYDLTDWLLEDSIDEGTGPMQLFNKWPAQVERMHICPWAYECECGCCPSDCEDSECEGDHECDHDYCDLHDLPSPDLSRLWNDPKAPSVTTIWGWRPTK